jgi:hypothetical protein
MNKVILVAFVAILWISCSKTSDIPSSIAAKWYKTNVTNFEYTNGVLDNKYTLNYNHTDFMVFNSDGTGSSVSVVDTLHSTDTMNFSYKLSGKTLSFTFPRQLNHGDSILPISKTMSILTNNKLEITEGYTDFIENSHGTDTVKGVTTTDYAK